MIYQIKDKYRSTSKMPTYSIFDPLYRPEIESTLVDLLKISTLAGTDDE